MSARDDPATAPVACDLCGSTGGRTLLRTAERRFGLGGSFALVRCPTCMLVRTEPQPQDPARWYPDSTYYSFAPPSPPSARTRERLRRAYGDGARGPTDRLTREIASRLTPGLPPGPPGDVLDVGCGSGEMLLALREAGWRPHGIEPSEPAVAAAHAAGLDDVRVGDLVEAGFDPASFDAVRFWHSLEHTPRPRAQLEEARRVLRPGGRLVVGVPNFGSLLSRLTRERWFYLDVPRHLWHFERGTLARLAREAGFADVQVRCRSTSTPILGTVDFLRGREAAPSRSRRVWLSVLPVAAALDAVRLGDALELTATVR